MKKKIITITGAAGNIAYSLIFRLLSGQLFPKNTKIQLNLLDIPESSKILQGVKYEIEDCAFESLDSIITTENMDVAFGDSDYILLVGAKPRIKGMQRSDLLLDNANIFKKQGIAINQYCKNSVRIIVVGKGVDVADKLENINYEGSLLPVKYFNKVGEQNRESKI